MATRSNLIKSHAVAAGFVCVCVCVCEGTFTWLLMLLKLFFRNVKPRTRHSFVKERTIIGFG